MLSSPTQIAYDFPEKLQFLFQPARYKVAYGGRDGAKSWGFARALLILGLSGKERILCAREFQRSLDESVHKLLADQITRMKMNYLYDVQQAHIIGRASAQGTLFSFEGLHRNVEKIKSYEGITRCWVEEATKMSRDSFNILVPTIRVEGSELWFTYNPDHEDDFIHQYFAINTPPPGSVVVKTTWRDNRWLSSESLAAIKHMQATDPDQYLHVYEGHTRHALEGAVFAEELRACAQEERIRHVPYERGVPVDAFFDLGRDNYTSIWFTQRVGFEHRIINFYQNRLQHIDHYLKTMQQLSHVYGTIWLPHDARAKTLGTRMSIEEQVRAAGYNVRIVPKLDVKDRINAARSVFPNCFFDAKNTIEGLKSLRSYKFHVDPASRTRSREPEHDWASDASDAFCYFAVASGLRVRQADCKLEKPLSLRLASKFTDIFNMPLQDAIRGVQGQEKVKKDGWLGR
jgi:phage terminase large subunit